MRRRPLHAAATVHRALLCMEPARLELLLRSSPISFASSARPRRSARHAPVPHRTRARKRHAPHTHTHAPAPTHATELQGGGSR